MLSFKSTQLHTIGLAVALPVLLVAGACSRESKQASPVTTETDAGKSRAPESAKAAGQMDQALVRVVNVAPDAKAIDVLADNNPAFAAVDYKTVTPYKNVPSSADEFAIKPAGDAEAKPLAQNSESISGGRHYTVVVLPNPSDGKLELQVINDDIQPPTEGKARVRVINASPDAPTLAVFVRGQQEALFSDVDFKEAASYKEVDPLSGTLEFRSVASRMAMTDAAPGATPTAAREPNGARDAKTDNPRPDDHAASALATTRVTLEPGKTYTLIVSGHRAGRTGAVDTLLIEDTLTGPQTAPTE